MATADIIASILSFFALLISVVTAYKTLLARFKAEIFVSPRIILNHLNKIPSMVIGCDIQNRGAKANAIEDIVLRVIYRQQGQLQDTKSISTYLFLPALIRDDYNIFKNYQDTDFEPFQSISIIGSSRVTKYIVFTPSNNDGFSPALGEIELQVFSRNLGDTKWRKAKSNLKLPVDEGSANTWKDPNGKTILLEAAEHKKLRVNLMEQVSR
jgi:hypothetical protein